MPRWRLDFEAGGELTLRRGVTLVGRHPACDIVLDNATISRRQLLLQPRADGVELVKLGRQEVRCDGEALEEQVVIAGDGARLAIGGVDFATIRALADTPEEARWLISLDGGPALKLIAPFTIGGSPSDDLTVPGWPRAALRLHDTEAAVLVELADAASELVAAEDAARFDPDGFARLEPGRPLLLGGHRLALVRSAAELRSSTLHDDAAPLTLRAESYGRGGVITTVVGGEERSVYLPRLRFALLRALIAPPPPAAPGDYLDVESLCEIVWPGNHSKTEYDFNVLLHRVRRDLLRAELDVDALIERAHGSGMIRAPAAAEAEVVVDGVRR
ncbi:MAG: FHA domain-containing protein [Myxococcales bacterium]|nr:FHA domain-containing protein [Myxococcales bacterium]